VGRTTGERVWRLPLDRDYADMIKGRYAQLTNVTERREASAITAAEFLHHFAGEVPWAHLDIAGTAYGARRPYFDKGATRELAVATGSAGREGDLEPDRGRRLGRARLIGRERG
jgi:leucyl aminopeptidase